MVQIPQKFHSSLKDSLTQKYYTSNRVTETSCRTLRTVTKMADTSIRFCFESARLFFFQVPTYSKEFVTRIWCISRPATFPFLRPRHFAVRPRSRIPFFFPASRLLLVPCLSEPRKKLRNFITEVCWIQNQSAVALHGQLVSYFNGTDSVPTRPPTSTRHRARIHRVNSSSKPL